MTGLIASRTAWRKSSHSGGDGTECVEVARADRLTAVRDSKNPTGPVLSFTQPEWTAFLAHLKHSDESFPV
jgi:hypothetical protein